ncbi:MAG TPA: RNA chaperone Hfq [Acidobacteriaceae bacterium]|jgi:host factor-I protein|nr:RNA chaperone Hfq [Acidobacteriaceae bacterium]
MENVFTLRWIAGGKLAAQASRYNLSRYNEGMAPEHSSSRRRQKNPPPGETGQEALYLRSLSERQVPVHVKLRDGETVSGWIEYFDDRMIRLTREGKPNLFIYKQQIRTISEHGRAGRRRVRKEAGAERGAEDAQ